MDNIIVKVVADSVNPNGERITSFELTYPRFIHSELMTHRQLSRNAASSRAIPIKKQLKAVWSNPAHPEQWGKNQSGMQANESFTGRKAARRLRLWKLASKVAVCSAWVLWKVGLHKQIVNRVLEPFSYMTVLCTATDWTNFFALRAHPAAQPEFQVLAYAMLMEYELSEPKLLQWGDMHTPYSADGNVVESVASAARVSYTKHGDDFPFKKQEELHNRMLSMGHWSPFEHQAEACKDCKQSGNFRGAWLQYRQTFANQEAKDINVNEMLFKAPSWIRNRHFENYGDK